MSNPEAEFVAKMLAEGWEVTKRGWPDFICRRNGELMYVEVKGPTDGLSSQQYAAISDLRRAGIPTYIWGPHVGFTEVGPPVGESVFSLRQTIAELRRHIERLENPEPTPIDSSVVRWVFQEDDEASLRFIRNDCRKTHSQHWDSRLPGDGGTFCYGVAVLMRDHSAEQIMALGHLGSLGKTRRTIDNIRAKMFEFQHERIHRDQPGRRCTECAEAA